MTNHTENQANKLVSSFMEYYLAYVKTKASRYNGLGGFDVVLGQVAGFREALVCTLVNESNHDLDFFPDIKRDLETRKASLRWELDTVSGTPCWNADPIASQDVSGTIDQPHWPIGFFGTSRSIETQHMTKAEEKVAERILHYISEFRDLQIQYRTIGREKFGLPILTLNQARGLKNGFDDIKTTEAAQIASIDMQAMLY
ncbi:MAG: hypothetical protein JWM56_798 [Candidatus Peribacteria bacterium]|nr:hypothetical protein [Candidatus Peribacteria bacterium]